MARLQHLQNLRK